VDVEGWCRGGTTGGGGTNGNNLPHKGHFCESSKTNEKKLWVRGGVTLPTIFEFQFEFVTSSFQRPDLTSILSTC